MNSDINWWFIAFNFALIVLTGAVAVYLFVWIEDHRCKHELDSHRDDN